MWQELTVIKVSYTDKFLLISLVDYSSLHVQFYSRHKTLIWYDPPNWNANHLPQPHKWKEVPAAQVSCGPAFTHTELKPTWLSTSSNHGGGASAKYGGGGHQSSMGGHQPSMGGHQPTMGGPSAKYGGLINQLWGASAKYGGPSAKYGGVINQLWGVHQPSMGGSSTNYGGASAKYGGGVFSHQYVQEVKIQRITLATHMSCRL